MKKILFICGSIEPGHDGVGDYTRTLAGALVERGKGVKILALKDRAVSGMVEETQETRGQRVDVVRLSEHLSLRAARKTYQELVKNFEPEWISLQYVPYAYSPKGIPFYLSRFLRLKNSDVKWHLMVHEAFIGNEGNLKWKIIRTLQIQNLRKLNARIAPRITHTSNHSYQEQLKSIQIDSGILRLFGNIPPQGNTIKLDSDSVLRGIYFGAAPKKESAETLVKILHAQLPSINKRLEIVLCGNSGEAGRAFANFLRNNLDSKYLEVIEKGKMTEFDLSSLFLSADFGIARVPPHLLGKSGSSISMLEHGLPLWIPLAKNSELVHSKLDFRDNQCLFNLSEINVLAKKFEVRSSLTDIAGLFDASLKG